MSTCVKNVLLSVVSRTNLEMHSQGIRHRNAFIDTAIDIREGIVMFHPVQNCNQMFTEAYIARFRKARRCI